jgi:hypothetical protein
MQVRRHARILRSAPRPRKARVLGALAFALSGCLDEGNVAQSQRLDEARIARIGYAHDAGLGAPDARVCASPCGATQGATCESRCRLLCDTSTAETPCTAAERWRLSATVTRTGCGERAIDSGIELPAPGGADTFDLFVGPSGEVCPALADGAHARASLFSRDCLAPISDGLDLEVGWGYDDPVGVRRLFWVRGRFESTGRVPTARGIIDRRDYGPTLDCTTEYAFTGTRLASP